MPSVGEIFTVSGVDVGAGVDVVSGMEVLEVSKVSAEVCEVGAGVEVGEGGVAVLWQAASKKMEKRRMIFFIELCFVGRAFSPTFIENANIGGLQIRPTEPAALPFLPGLRKNWDSLYRPFARL
jgi:hypothetical protein